MKHISIGGLEVSRIGLGAMRRSRRVRSSGWAPITSTCTTSTGSIRRRRSRTPSAPWPHSSPRARFVTSGCRRLVPPRSVALAWLLAQGDDIAPITGTKRVARVEENTAADRIELSAEQIARLNNLTPAVGARHDEGNMAVIDG